MKAITRMFRFALGHDRCELHVREERMYSSKSRIW
jgi:hypothetical protein